MCSDFSLNGFSPTYYSVYPMLSASGNLFKCYEEVFFFFLPVVLVFLYSIPGVFCLSGGGGIASSSLKKNYYYCNPELLLIF